MADKKDLDIKITEKDVDDSEVYSYSYNTESTQDLKEDKESKVKKNTTKKSEKEKKESKVEPEKEAKAEHKNKKEAKEDDLAEKSKEDLKEDKKKDEKDKLTLKSEIVEKSESNIDDEEETDFSGNKIDESFAKKKTDDPEENFYADEEDDDKVSMKFIIGVSIIIIIIAAFFLIKSMNTENGDIQDLNGDQNQLVLENTSEEPVNPVTEDFVIATVNNKSIYSSEIEEQYNNIPENYKPVITKEIILNRTIIDILLMEEIEKLGITVESIEIGDLIQQTIGATGTTEEEFMGNLEEQGITIEDFEELYEKQIKINKLLDLEAFKDVMVDSSKIYDFYVNNQELYTLESSYRASHILLDNLDEAQDIMDRIDSGESFLVLAKEFSIDDVSRENSGDIGFFTLSQVVPEFAQAISQMSVGGVSGPVQSQQFGFHIIKLTAKKPPRVLPFEEVKDDIEEELERLDKTNAYQEYVNLLFSEAEIIFNDQNNKE